ncbi:MAG: hypothetical protein HOK84_09455, partial [Bacteroidetes bacterium]|nr:hypothetical protein [Bacteroidota bacterium]
APYYVQRYGFYEGHTSYRMDPRLIALTFGLITIDELIEKDILPDDESFKACPDAYIPQDSLWEQFRIAHSLLKNDPDSLSAKIKKIYAQSVGQLRRLCLNDILSDFEGDPIGLLLNEISIAHWEADTLASNHLISLGNRSIQGIRDIFLNTAHDSLVRWRALSVIGKINPMATKELMQFAEKDPSWIIRKEAAFISLAR